MWAEILNLLKTGEAGQSFWKGFIPGMTTGVAKKRTGLPDDEDDMNKMMLPASYRNSMGRNSSSTNLWNSLIGGMFGGNNNNFQNNSSWDSWGQFLGGR